MSEVRSGENVTPPPFGDIVRQASDGTKPLTNRQLFESEEFWRKHPYLKELLYGRRP